MDKMSWARLIVRVVVSLVAFSVGLRAASAPLSVLWQRRNLMVRSLIAVLLVVPALAVLWVKALTPSAEVAAGLLVSAVAVGPVMALKKTKGASAELSYALGLNLTLLVLSLVFVPLAAWLIAALFHHELRLNVGTVAEVILPLQLLPLVAGIAVGRLAPKLTARVEKKLTLAANLAFGAVVVVLLVLLAKPLLALGSSNLLIIASLGAAAIAVGHFLGGPEEGMRNVLAAFSSIRFPALALAVAGLTEQRLKVVPVVLCYALCTAVVYAAYLALERFRTRPTSSHDHTLPAH